MRKLTYLVLLTLLFCFKSFSQSIDLKDSDVTEMLSKAWMLDYGLLNGEKIQGLEIVDDEYIFESNHTYKLISADSSFVTGNWLFNQDKKRIELYSKEGSSSGYIISIEKDKLIMIPGENSVPEIFKMEFFFKPKL